MMFDGVATVRETLGGGANRRRKLALRPGFDSYLIPVPESDAESLFVIMVILRR